MPYIEPDTAGHVLTYEQAAVALGVTIQTIRKYVVDDKLPWIYTGNRLGNGHREKGIPAAAVLARARDFSSPAETTTAPAPTIQPPDAADVETAVGPKAGRGDPPSLRQTALVDNSAVERPDHLPEHIPLTADGLPDVAAMEALGLREQADEWSLRMMALREFREARDGAEHGDKRAAGKRVGRQWSLSLRTLYRYDQQERDGGPTALMPGYAGGRADTCLPDELQRQILDFYLDQRQPSAAQTYRHIVLPYYAADGRQAPHEGTIRRWLREHVTPLMEQAFRHGRRAYDARIRPKVIRERPEPNKVWCADHRLWDVHVLCPDGNGTGWGSYGARPCPCGSGRKRRDCCSLRRPWITAIVDVGSAAWVGWRIGVTPTAAGVCHALRDALLTFGIPEKFLRDNGKEFVANVLGGRAARLRDPEAGDLADRRRWPAALPGRVETSGIWPALGVHVVTANPYSAWSKPIEPLFRAFSQIEDENLTAGWAGRDAAGRPEQLERHVEKGLVLTWNQFAQSFAGQINHWNTEHTCGGRDAPPVHLYSGLTLRIPDESTVAFLLRRERAGVAVTAQGVLADGRRYFSPELARYVGQRLPLIRWDDERPEQIVAYTPDDRVLAVPLAQKATWDGWGDANRIAAQGAREQRAILARTAYEIRGACPIERLDPTGTYELVARRVAAQQDQGLAEAAAREQAALEAADRPADPRPTGYSEEEIARIRRRFA